MAKDKVEKTGIKGSDYNMPKMADFSAAGHLGKVVKTFEREERISPTKKKIFRVREFEKGTIKQDLLRTENTKAKPKPRTTEQRIASIEQQLGVTGVMA